MEANLLNLLGSALPPISGEEVLWNFLTPDVGVELSISVGTLPAVADVGWGDLAETVVADVDNTLYLDSSLSLDPSTIVSHTYSGATLSDWRILFENGWLTVHEDYLTFSSGARFDVLNKGDVTKFITSALGGDWPTDKLGGTFDANAIPYAHTIHVIGHDINTFIVSQYARELVIRNNQLTGSVTDYLTYNVNWIELQSNLLTGPIPDLSSYDNLRVIGTTSNSLGGSVPNLPTNIEVFDFADCEISGDLPLLDQYTQLNRCWMYSNSGLSIPNNWAASPLLKDLRMHSCSFTATEVNTVLIAMDALGTSDGILHLHGDNAAPTGAGNTAKSALIGRGWTVQTQ